ncbi:MAG: hypothetical protein ACI825_001284 [Planctomycetota bacterium]|jgi:hypothetical protein|uniref:hypothetical protein n=1 Tax=Patiriisocius sp. Uisw_047 TaxID=3230969 RepID=UPI0039EA3DA7
MKKVFLLVALFLSGIAMQAETNTHPENVTINPGKKHRYTNVQEITFIENGVLYAVTTGGSFSYEFLHPSQKDYRRGGQKQVFYKDKRRSNHTNHNNGRRTRIKRDYNGNIISIGHSQITYQRNGKVKRIGKVPLQYYRSALIQVGNMEIIYNLRGNIRYTYGFINRKNRKQWHDDWYTYSDGRRDRNDTNWNNLERQHNRKRKSK